MRANTIDLLTLDKLFYVDYEFKLRWKINRKGSKGINSLVGYISDQGYITTEIKGKQYRVHRIIYQMVNSIELLESSVEIDHIDLDNKNNNPANLRSSTAMQNSRNRSRMKDNTSGFKGVSYDKKSNKWRARIRVNYKLISLGNHCTKEEAFKAYSEAAVKYHLEFHRL